MDKIENFISDELSQNRGQHELDIDAVIHGTHKRLRKRATRRKILYSSPIVALLIMMVISLSPKNDAESILPGDELFMAGWEHSWTESQSVELDEMEDSELFEQSVDYLIDEHFYTYIDDAEDVLDDEDLEALLSYLKEA